ncbi:MAG: glycosyltransferase [Leptolyngbyaceae cyanobacterium bins.59]|nr:glycosyltransferase [Leptolyngbyaceae cyanobacterium bins.59]
MATAVRSIPDCPSISVAICTYNRAESLRRTLTTLRETTQSVSVAWELLLIDNNSSDRTSEVAHSFSDLPLRYIFEPQQGLSRARNRALAEAKGPFILYTDDDVDIQPGWLETYVAILGRYPDIAFAGGTIRPSWKNIPPPWVEVYAPSWLNGVVVWCDGGEAATTEFVFDRQRHYIYGANFGFRTEMLRTMGGFNTEIGRQGGNLLGGEDMQAIDQLARSGHFGLFLPQAIVEHRIHADRWSKGYIFRSSVGHGRIRAMQRSHPPHRWLGSLPVKLTLEMVGRAIVYVISLVTGKADRWLPALCELGWAVGEWQQVRVDR